MIEIPAAAYTADLLAREVDFFTIGTNDLIQYCLAVDRADERVSRLYEPLHPAILRVIVMVRRAAARQRIPVSLCGEMASDPALLTLLVGLGLTRVQHDAGRHRRRQAGRWPSCAATTCARWRAGSCGCRPSTRSSASCWPRWRRGREPIASMRVNQGVTVSELM